MNKDIKSFLCPICGLQPMCDSTGELLLDESGTCGLCGRHVCRGCVFTDEDLRSMDHSGDLPQYIVTSIEPHWDYLCWECLCNIEKDYIDEIPSEDLPLHINDDWYFKENKPYFNKKLEKTGRGTQYA